MDETPIVVVESQVNPHQSPEFVEQARQREAAEAYAMRPEVQRGLRAELRAAVARICELKVARAKPGQPGWAGSGMGVELEEMRGLATLLCVSRARSRNRQHPVALPRTILIPPLPGTFMGKARRVETLVELKRLSDEVVGVRCEPIPLPPPELADAAEIGRRAEQARENIAKLAEPKGS